MPSVSQADYELLATFRQTLREFIRFSEQAAAAARVPPQQHQAMLLIKGSPERRPLTVGRLAEQLQIRHQSAVGLINRMVGGGLVRKSTDPTDHRGVLIELTARGEKLLRRLSAAHKAEIARIGPALRRALDELNSAV